ncbi:unnamed protein product [Rhizopus stolonifer]
MLVSMVFDLERDALMVKKSMDLMDCRKDSARAATLIQVIVLMPTLACCTRNRPFTISTILVSLVVLPVGLFGAVNTTSIPSVPSSPHRTDLESDEYGLVAMDNG